MARARKSKGAGGKAHCEAAVTDFESFASQPWSTGYIALNGHARASHRFPEILEALLGQSIPLK